MQQMNRSYLAHIVADSANGPRGDAVESPLLKADLSNLMLLCGDHHRLIDGPRHAEYPVDWLREQKREHEERIERQTGMQPAKRTHIVLIGTRIGTRRGDVTVNEDEARAAVLPARYPATDHAIRVDLSELDLTEQDPTFWQVAQLHAQRRLAAVVASTDATGRPINHLSIFGFASIPVLIYCGSLIRDLITADVFQRHRSPASWEWAAFDNDGFNYTTTYPEAAVPKGPVAINISLSGHIHQHEIDRALAEPLPTYGITIATPSPTFLRAKEQLELFTLAWRNLLSRVRQEHGDCCEIHLFAAVPVLVAIEIGRPLLPKVDPVLHVYNLDKETKTFKLALSIHQE